MFWQHNIKTLSDKSIFSTFIQKKEEKCTRRFEIFVDQLFGFYFPKSQKLNNFAIFFLI